MNLADHADGVRAGRRVAIARAVTLVESARPADRAAARQLLDALAGPSRAHRIGISGVPGAGKSTLTDALGARLLELGLRVAVLAVDPSSERTGGSILGDRTRMARLAADPRAYVRPSPSGGELGGVTRRTADVLTVLEAAGFDVVVVETVGVGQSETVVADLVDSFLLLTVAGTGDGLQGIKMGVLERADVVAVNKADGAGLEAARAAARELRSALRLLPRGAGREAPVVTTCSAADGSGIAELWTLLHDRYAEREAGGELAAERGRQEIRRLRSAVRHAVLDALAASPGIAAATRRAEEALAAGIVSPAAALEHILDAAGLTTGSDPATLARPAGSPGRRDPRSPHWPAGR